jgi:hypothetical protein
MQGMSKEDLKDKLSTLYWSTDDCNQLITAMMFECKELPELQWQTLKEFKANPVIGLCFINYGDKNEFVDSAYYVNKVFYWNDMTDTGQDFSDVKITHVMPIKTPETPK